LRALYEVDPYHHVTAATYRARRRDFEVRRFMVCLR